MECWPVLLGRTPSKALVQHWRGVAAISIKLQQRRALLCRAAVCVVLVSRLLCFQRERGFRQPLHLAERTVSQRHFLGSSKNQAGRLFEEGQQMYGEQRYNDAAQKWGQAALLQHAPSHAFLSDMLVDGRPGVADDGERAFELACYGAALGCAHSKGALSRCYIYGRGVDEDDAKGLALARESAAAGSAFGQFVVGICHLTGRGVEKDHAKAVQCFCLAAAQGLAYAQVHLGTMYCSGRGVAQDEAEAVRLYYLAAAQGHYLAYVNLGRMFQNGKGVAQDVEEAKRWYHLAAAQGDRYALRLLQSMVQFETSRCS
jgi:TPR repeat protein